MQSLQKQRSLLADTKYQVELLEHNHDFSIIPFQQKMEKIGLYPLRPNVTEIFQVNIGKVCNQTCRHCHVDAGPDRKEIMKRETMQQCLEVLKYNPDRQRGEDVFEKSIKALQMLNEAGYGKKNSRLILNLVYNPAGAFLPPSQEALKKEYKIKEKYSIDFHDLYVITNMPISRYLDYLLTSGNYEKYMEKIVAAFNPAAASNVICRNTISVGWDGYLFDCDFNQMLDLKVSCSAKHISDYNEQRLSSRNISIGQHCYGCTAGSGSSCGGIIAYTT